MITDSNPDQTVSGGSSNISSGVIFAGYLCCFLSLFFLPALFALVALLIGIVTVARGRVGHGVLLLLLAVACGGYGIGTHYNRSTPNTQYDTSGIGSTHSEEPPFSVTIGDVTYYGSLSSDVGVAVLAVQMQPYLIGYELIRPDGKFITVMVAITNHQHDAIVMNTSLFEIVDSSGNVYSASEKSLEVQPDAGLFLAQINPGITKTGEIVFDVPQNLSMDNLRLRFRGGMTGDTADLDLRVNSVNRRAEVPTQQEPTAQISPASPAVESAVATAVNPSAVNAQSQPISVSSNGGKSS